VVLDRPIVVESVGTHLRTCWPTSEPVRVNSPQSYSERSRACRSLPTYSLVSLHLPFSTTNNHVSDKPPLIYRPISARFPVWVLR